MELIWVTSTPKRARAAGCTVSASQVSSSAIMEQSSVAVELKATVPPASAVTLKGTVSPQMPGPLISAAGWT